jgi:TonB family protein
VSDVGITPPTVILERKPIYPSEALKARIEGDVIMECVVQTTGLCDDIHVAKSFDPMWLD